jgi:hypothetical protein
MLAPAMGTAGKRLNRFFSEARRRRVFSVAAVYIIGAWVVLQVADTLFPAWDIPDRAMQFVVYAVLLGFPIALLFGWRYDIGARGISWNGCGETRPSMNCWRPSTAIWPP